MEEKGEEQGEKMKLTHLRKDDIFELNQDRFVLKRKIVDRYDMRCVVECLTGYNLEKGIYSLGRSTDVHYVGRRRENGV